MVWHKRYDNLGLSLAVVALIMMGAFIITLSAVYAPGPEAAMATVVVNGNIINAEVVSRPADMYRGLSGRASLCADCGMLFDFPDSDARTFVMRDMNFPLDMIFINEGRIIYIAANLAPEGSQPANLYSAGPADQVLEVNGGYSAAHDIKAGDKVYVSGL